MTLPLFPSLISTYDDPDDQLDTLNTFFSNCLEDHAPLRRCRVTRPPAPWMDDETIRALQLKRDNLRREAHRTNTEMAWTSFREVRQKTKLAIRKARTAFMEKSLLSNKSKDVWHVLHSILNPPHQPSTL